MREALTGARPAFLFGTVPAMEGTPLPKVREQAVKFAAKMRELAADGYIVYDIQEEAGRTEEPRPFPFRRMSDPVEYAGTFASEVPAHVRGPIYAEHSCARAATTLPAEWACWSTHQSCRVLSVRGCNPRSCLQRTDTDTEPGRAVCNRIESIGICSQL